MNISGPHSGQFGRIRLTDRLEHIHWGVMISWHGFGTVLAALSFTATFTDCEKQARASSPDEQISKFGTTCPEICSVCHRR
jgi:hypothetical protein